MVAILPNETQLSGTSSPAGTAPVRKADNSVGTYADAIHDYFLPLMKYYETWGRDVDVKFVTSSGSDESSQRADAVTVKADKPFAVIDLVTAGLDVLDAEIAKAKILVYGDATTTAKALAQAPYRWGLSDAQAAAVNSGEVIGKQLVGKKAELRRRRRHQEADPQVRRGVHPDAHRHRAVQELLQQVRRHAHDREPVHQQRDDVRRRHASRRSRRRSSSPR